MFGETRTRGGNLLRVRRSVSASLALAATALFSFVPACGGPRPVTLHEGPREYVGADYDAILKRWTRSERLYSFQGVDDVLAATATFESWDFRWAYVIR